MIRKEKWIRLAIVQKIGLVMVSVAMPRLFDTEIPWQVWWLFGTIWLVMWEFDGNE